MFISVLTSIIMLKFLSDQIAAILHSRLPNPLGEQGFIFCTQYKI